MMENFQSGKKCTFIRAKWDTTSVGRCKFVLKSGGNVPKFSGRGIYKSKTITSSGTLLGQKQKIEELYNFIKIDMIELGFASTH